MNWNKLSYRNKNKVLIATTFLLLIVIYWLALSKTFSLYFENTNLEKQLNLAKEAPEQIKQLEGKSLYLQGTINYLSEDDDLRKELLNIIGNASQSHHVLFKTFKDSHIQRTDDIVVETHEVVLQGSFLALLRLVYDLEKELSIGKVVSLKFELEEDRRTQKENLIARVYVQSIQKINDEGGPR